MEREREEAEEGNQNRIWGNHIDLIQNSSSPIADSTKTPCRGEFLYWVFGITSTDIIGPKGQGCHNCRFRGVERDGIFELIFRSR